VPARGARAAAKSAKPATTSSPGSSAAHAATIVVRADPGLPRDRADKLVTAGLRAEGLEVSRATVQRWMKEGRVTRFGEPVDAHDAVRDGDSLEVRPGPPPPSSAEPDATIQVHVLFEDAYLLVLDKPAGLVVHPAKGHLDGTLVNALLARPAFGAGLEKDQSLRPGIVHRLDKGTSGIMVVAKDDRTREGLKALFAAHDIEREYVAVVVGAAKDATIDTLHGRHPRDRTRFTSRGAPVGPRRAVTHVRVLERLDGATIVACTLETGRTHQIRVHLAEQLGTPVLADPVYGARKASPRIERIASALGRQALHARVLGFQHPITGRRVRWESPLPPDIARAIKALRDGGGAATRPSTSRGPWT
jgi:23S rRNA pseudouridine1911/1915/1917 synthase